MSVGVMDSNRFLALSKFYREQSGSDSDTSSFSKVIDNFSRYLTGSVGQMSTCDTMSRLCRERDSVVSMMMTVFARVEFHTGCGCTQGIATVIVLPIDPAYSTDVTRNEGHQMWMHTVRE